MKTANFVIRNLSKAASNAREQIFHNGLAILWSYETPVAVLTRGEYLRTSTDYSRTTTRHIKDWIGEAKARKVEQSLINKLAGLKK